MTEAELDSLRADIHANPDCADAVARKHLDDLAAIASVGRTKLQQTFIGFGGVMTALGAVRGAEVLDALDAAAASNSAVKRAVALLTRGVLDLGSEEARAEMAALSPAIFTADDIAKLNALGEVPAPYTRLEVEAAVFNPDGSLK